MLPHRVQCENDRVCSLGIGDRELLRGAEELMSVDQCETTRELDDSKFVGELTGAVKAGANVVVKEDARALDLAVGCEPKVAEMSFLKRKRGRPPRIMGKTGQQPPPQQRRKKDEEDVCFICFDGGSLVLCDRRGCPKAYHSSCVKRDEAFFRSKAKWNCGWHICSTCQKASHYMCYTCTYSLCKGCTKDADYLCLRGNKGLCGTCMKMVMLIENISLGGTEEVQVDFDDKTSWEYLFKVYWVYLKVNLSLTLDELIKAKNPWKGEELPTAKNSWKGSVALTSEVDSSGELSHVSDNYCSSTEANHSKRRKTENQPMSLLENPLVREQSAVHKYAPSAEGTMWATKELLQFVTHVKNGDISMLSKFDVHSLLLEYIKRNNLCDPHRKSQIICDSLLTNLFGKESVSHFEVLKLLDHHFLVKDKTPGINAVRAGVTAAYGSQVEASASNDSQMTTSNDQRRKTRKRADETGMQHNSDSDEHAAVDAYNINLLYLKRYLMENLMDDGEQFHEMVVGSFVRIRIPGGDQKQDIYRLAQVVGTSKVAESYKVGTRTTDVMLEILNLIKKEVVSIEEISNEDFSEDECKSLHQSMKCGLIQMLTVGEVQTKAMALKAVKVSDRLETEILRLIHLHDQARQKGHRKKLRECAKKLELLKSPAELHRRLLEAIYVHTDPNMDPICESDKDAEKKQGDYLRWKSSGVGRTGAELKSAVESGDISNDIGSCAQSSLDTSCELSQNITSTSYVDKDGTTLVHERYDARHVREQFELNDQPKEMAGPGGSVPGGCHTQAEVKCQSLTGVGSPVLTASSAGRELSVTDFEADKLWHYQDPSGKTQGPFAMMQLRKWYASGLFPFGLRVWRINGKLDDSILLTDALVRRYHNDQTPAESDYLQLQEVTLASDDTDKMLEVSSVTADATCVGNRNAEYSLKSVKIDGSAECGGSDELVKNGGWSSPSSSWTALVNVAISNHGLILSSSQSQETSDISKSWCDQPQIRRSILSPSVSVNLCETPPQVRDNHLDKNLTSSLSDLNEHALKTIKGQPDIRERDEKQAESDSFSSQSSRQGWRSPPILDSSSGSDSNSDFIFAAKSTKTYDLNQEVDFFDLSIPTPKENHENLKVQASAIKQLVSSTVPVLESGSSWSRSSSLVVSGGQIPELAGEWRGAKTPSIPSAEEWESTLASASSWKPTEGAIDLMTTTTPESGQLTHSPPCHPVIDSSSWQQIEPNEFCSLADESVSDLLAEVEAMESLVGLPSPTSRMSCCEDMAKGSDDDCFSLVERICPTPEPGTYDALRSSDDIRRSSQLTIADDPLRLCHMPYQPIVTNGLCEMPSQLLMTDQWLGLSYMPSHSTATAELPGASKMFSLSTLTDEPLEVSHTGTFKPKTSFSVHSCSSAKAELDRKLNEVSVNQWEGSSERQCHTASTALRETNRKGLAIVSSVGQQVSFSDIRATSTTNVSWRTVKENTDMSQKGADQGNTSTSWGTNQWTSKLHGSANSTCSVGSPGSWENQPRYGDDRFSGPGEHRNYFQ